MDLSFLTQGGALRGALAQCLADEILGVRPAAQQRHGPFVIERLIARGGFGAVYEARRDDGRISQRVAIKVLHSKFVEASAKARFIQEREVLARLDHPNIARLFDANETDDGIPYYVMEFIDGQPIDRYCAENCLSVSERVSLLIQVCQGIAFAHQNLVVHRDIKPSNVLVTPDRGVKIVDFGIAKVLEGASTDSTLTQALAPMTPAYAAPEQFQGEPITVATDIYQLGTLAYWLLTGELPYKVASGSPLEWAQAVASQIPRSMSRTCAEIVTPEAEAQARSQPTPRHFGDLESIVAKALAKAPKERYATANAFIDDLQAYLEHRPVAARKVSALYLTSRFVRRHRWAVSLGLAIAIGFASLTVFAIHAARQAQLDARHSRQTSNFLRDTLLDLSPRKTGDDPTPIVLRTLGKARARLFGIPELDSKARAELLVVIAQVYNDFRAADLSKRVALEALHELNDLSSPDLATLAKANTVAMSAAYYLGDYADAVSRSESQIAALSGKGPEFSQYRSAAYHIGGIALAETGRTQEAIQRFGNGVDECKLDPEPNHCMATALSGLGNSQRTLGKWKESKQSLETSLNLERSASGSESTFTYWRMGFLSSTLAEMGEFEAAGFLARKALEGEKRTYGSDSIGTAQLSMQLGYVLYLQGEYDKALSLFDAARSKYRTEGDVPVMDVAWSELFIGRTLLKMGFPLVARDHCDISRERSNYIDGHAGVWTADALDCAAEANAQLGNLIVAHGLAEQSLQLRRTWLSWSSPWVVTSEVRLVRIYAQAGVWISANETEMLKNRARAAFPPASPLLAECEALLENVKQLRPAMNLLGSGKQDIRN